MRFFSALKTGVIVTALCLCLQGQDAPGKDPQVNETKGLPPRASPADYEARAQAGPVTVAAEFKGHFVPTQDGTYTSEDYVAIETGLFGASGARTRLSSEDFSLRINGKKAVLSSQHYLLVFHSLKDPEWVPPDAPEAKSKTSFGGGGGQDSSTPVPPKMPIELQLAMQQRVKKAVLPEGDRALPQAGLIFFEYRGKTEHIHSIELTYTGPAGKATLTLHP
jgi:hypothetical protein